MKKIFVLGSILVLLASPVSAHAILIDNFSTYQTLSVPPGNTKFDTVDDAGDPYILGEERDVIATATGGTADLQIIVDAGGSGTFAINAPTSQTWDTTIQWDGSDDNDTLDYTGLGGVDLTDGGVNDRFGLWILESDHPTDPPGSASALSIEVYTSATQWSSYSIPSLGPIWQLGQEFVVKFDDFVDVGGFGGADFTNVGAIQLTIASSMGAHDVQLDFFQTTSTPGAIIVEKQTIPAGATDNFTFTTSYGGDFTLKDDETNNSGPLQLGTYSVSEIDIPAGWTLTNSDPTCSDGSSASAIDLNPGETVTCTFENEGPQPQTGTIIVEKQTNPDGAQDPFTFSGDANGDIKDGEQIVVPGLQAGIYTSTEIVPAGWDLTAIDCSDGNSSGDLNKAEATFQLEAGETVTCTFTNTKRGTIIVEKQTDPDGAQDEFTFTGDAHGDIKDGKQIVVSDLQAGIYTSTETVPQGWDLTAIDCSDGNSSGDLNEAEATFQLEAGETVTCIFTNTKRGTIIVEKQTVPDGAPDSFTFSGDASGSIKDSEQIVVGNLTPGTYTSTETVPAGWNLAAIKCNDANSSGDLDTRTATFQLEAGETVKCAFTNTLPSTVESATGSGEVTFGPDQGVIQNLTAVAEETLPCPAEDKPDITFPNGFFSFTITSLATDNCPTGETIVLTITLPGAAPKGSEYWKCQEGAWLDVTSLLGDDDGDNVLTLTLTDGGLGDDDGLCNGKIVDPSAVGRLLSVVGGVVAPVNKLALLWPRVALIVAMVGLGIVVTAAATKKKQVG